MADQNTTQKPEIEAVAKAIGCPDWTSPEGCNAKGECFCATAAANVLKIAEARHAHQ